MGYYKIRDSSCLEVSPYITRNVFIKVLVAGIITGTIEITRFNPIIYLIRFNNEVRFAGLFILW